MKAYFNLDYKNKKCVHTCIQMFCFNSFFFFFFIGIVIDIYVNYFLGQFNYIRTHTYRAK